VSAALPAPIVALNRATIVAGMLIALAVRAPAITTLLFAIVASAAIFGRRGSLIYAAGTRILRGANAAAVANGRTEDASLTRFNNALAATLLGVAQLAFLAHAALAGWILASLTAVAAAVALAGYCIGCTLFYQFKAVRFRLRGQ